MKTLQVGGMTIVGASAEQEAVLMGRDAFIKAYCKEKGWGEDIGKLSLEQVMEIRRQDGWKNPK